MRFTSPSEIKKWGTIGIAASAKASSAPLRLNFAFAMRGPTSRELGGQLVGRIGAQPFFSPKSYETFLPLPSPAATKPKNDHQGFAAQSSTQAAHPKQNKAQLSLCVLFRFLGLVVVIIVSEFAKLPWPPAFIRLPDVDA